MGKRCITFYSDSIRGNGTKKRGGKDKVEKESILTKVKKRVKQDSLLEKREESMPGKV